MAEERDYTKLDGVIIHEGRIYPVARAMRMDDSIPVDMYMPSIVPNLPLVIYQQGRDPRAFYNLVQYPQATDIHTDCDVDTIALCQNAVTTYNVGSGSNIKRAKRITCSSMTIDDPEKLSDDNPDLTSLAVLTIGDCTNAIFPRLEELILFAPVSSLPHCVMHSTSIRNLTIYCAGDTHYDFTMMSALGQLWIYSLGIRVTINVLINDSVQDVRGYGVNIIYNMVNRSCMWFNNNILAISKYTTDINIYGNCDLAEPDGISNQIRRLAIYAGPMPAGCLGWVTKLTGLDELSIVEKNIYLPENVMMCFSRLSYIFIQNPLTDAHCGLISSTMIKLSAPYSHAVCQLTNLTSLTIKCNSELSPAIYGLTKLVWLSVSRDDYVPGECKCAMLFPPGFSAAFPDLRMLLTHSVIITPDMCMHDRPALSNWQHYTCAEHPPPAELARYASKLKFVVCDDTVAYPRALLPLIVRDGVAGYDLAPHFADPYDAVRACVMDRTPMTDYLRACYADGKYSTLFGFLPTDLIREITKYVDDSHVIRISGTLH